MSELIIETRKLGDGTTIAQINGKVFTLLARPLPSTTPRLTIDEAVGITRIVASATCCSLTHLSSAFAQPLFSLTKITKL